MSPNRTVCTVRYRMDSAYLCMYQVVVSEQIILSAIISAASNDPRHPGHIVHPLLGAQPCATQRAILLAEGRPAFLLRNEDS